MVMIMNQRGNRRYRYKVGGSLAFNHPTYVTRGADEELLVALREGRFCYVFNCRQMGKSSLLNRTMSVLKGEGMSCVKIDLTGMGGKEDSVSQWYGGLILDLSYKLDLEDKFNREAWEREFDGMSPIYKLNRFIQDVVLVYGEGERIFIFIDEIDKIISLDNKLDDLFALIRYCYNQREENPEYNRLTFALFGVATPADLIIDKTQTPFNIGYPIELTGLELVDSAPLMVGLEGKVANPEVVMGEILDWTGGQPFLTQRVCQLVVNSDGFIGEGREREEVANLVRLKVIEDWQSQDETNHLGTIRDRIFTNKQRAGRLLGLYREILLSYHDAVGAKHSGDNFCNLTEVSQSECFALPQERGDNFCNLTEIDTSGQNQELSPTVETGRSIRVDTSGQNQELSPTVETGRSIRIDTSGQNQELSPECFAPTANLRKRVDGIPADDTPEQTELRLSGLVVKQNGCLRVYNPIYAAIFNLDWVEESLQNLRPYGVAFDAWVESNFQDESRLLRGEALQEALAWKVGKSLSLVDDKFLDASRELELAVNKEENRILAEAKQKAQKQIKIGFVVLVVSIMAAISALVVAGNGIKDANIAKAESDSARKQTDKFKAESDSVKQERDKIKAESDLAKKESDLAKKEKETARQALTQVEKQKNDAEAKRQEIEKQMVVAKEEIAAVERKSQEVEANLQKAKADVNRANLEVMAKNQALAQFNQDLDQKNQAIEIANQNLAQIQIEKQKVIEEKQAAEALVKQAEVDIAEANITLESASSRALFLEGKNFDALLVGLRAGKQLKELEKSLKPNLPDTVCSKPFRAVSTEVPTTNTCLEVVTSLHQAVYGVKEFNTLEGHKDWVRSVSFSPDGKTIASGSDDGIIKLWNLEGKELLTLMGHESRVRSISFSPDGKTIASGSWDGTVKLWNREGKKLLTLTLDKDLVESVSFSPDGKTIATGSWDGVKLWNLEGKELLTLTEHKSYVKNVSFSPDGKTIASGSRDGTVKLWNLQGKELLTLTRDKDLVESVSFSPDSKTIASASGDGTVKLWNLESKELLTLTAHKNVVSSVSFSPDGQTIASASWDGTVKLWNLEGEELLSLTGDNNWLSSVSFSPDGKTIASGS
ncbi:MAG TPA: hypothetical protein DEA78_19570, partial [Cyanobacteria bacterium UBA11159]|nr:hypothetical protein [Cyanobacteria bacterium UBA11159]